MDDDTTMRMLAEAARKAANAAYAPYSGFRVGAAVLADDDRVFTGCNIENASYGLTNCAERTAVFKAVSDGARRLRAIAVAGGTDEPATPCGACRQVLAEFCDAGMPVRCVTLDGSSVRDFTLGELLPATFSMQGAGEVR